MYNIIKRNMKKIILSIVLGCISCHAMAQTPQEVQQFKAEVLNDLKDNILPFWMNNDVDPAGGFYGNLDRTGKPIKNGQKGGVLNARIIWSFSRAYFLFGNPRYKELADRAQDYYLNHFVDPEYGGTYWLLNADGSVKDSDKQTYGISYGIYGLSEHYRATGNRKSLDQAIALFRILEDKVRDPQKDGYIESYTRTWGTPKKLGYDGAGESSKTMNTHIHVLESYTNLYTVWRDAELKERLGKIIHLITDKFYNPQTHHLNLYFDDDWNNLENIASYGHDIETAWLLTEAAEVYGDEKLLERCREIALDLTDYALKEGLTSTNYMMYEMNGNHLRDDASWWCQAETVVGCVNAWQITGNSKYLQQAINTWQFIKNYMVDKEYGEWFRTVMPDLKPRLTDLKTSMWNCPYHNSRMGFEIFSRVKM